MKVTKSFVKQFEKEQAQFGTEVAIKNVIWMIAADIFKSIGIKSIKTK